MQLNNALWQYALNFYQQPSVEPACLNLQNRYGLSINRLIFACWAGSRGIRLEPEQFAGEAQDWQETISHPLRALRYKMREMKAEKAGLETCYDKLRQAELACEQVELALLFEQVAEQPVLSADMTLVAANLRVYLQQRQVPEDEQLSALLAPLHEASLALCRANPSD
ncbi:TIGR02444 family protein [Neptuniibacter halophilus]|uniref:TIGR02444 family protein n=1 Tax=Neptuniibacter halophilus TaxID=651666 RepID=UPI002572B6A1|nr:TIGR02444 family protein [Neptuniibacter halophilus]